MPVRKNFIFITLAAIVACGLTLRLCFWQLDRAAQKEILAQQLLASASAQPLTQAAFFSLLARRARTNTSASPAILALAQGLPSVDWLYRPVVLRGRWLPEHTVYLENRPMQGAAGFWVFTPFAIADSGGSSILVQRGWLPRHRQERSRIAPYRTASGEILLQAQMQGAPSQWATLGADTPWTKPSLERAPLIRLNLTIPEVQAQLAQTGHLQLLPFSLRENAAEKDAAFTASDGLGRNWSAPKLDVDKHYGYAAQWGAMSAVIAGLYLWFQGVAPWRRRRAMHTK